MVWLVPYMHALLTTGESQRVPMHQQMGTAVMNDEWRGGGGAFLHYHQVCVSLFQDAQCKLHQEI